jgi:hypothetical protein
VVGIPFPVCNPVSRFSFATRHSWISGPASGRSSGTLRCFPFLVEERKCYCFRLTYIYGVRQRLLPRFPFAFACAFDYECSLPCASGSWELFQAQDLSFPFSFALITGHLLEFICIGVRELVQRNIFF